MDSYQENISLSPIKPKTELKQNNRSMEPLTVERNQSTVRMRGTNYVLTLLESGYEQLPVDQAKDFFSEQTGFYDRLTLTAYFGTQAHVAKKTYRREARYQTGTYSMKDLTMINEVPTRKGYLEKMGLVTFEKRGSHWFMLILESAILVPQLFKKCVATMKNISLSANNMVVTSKIVSEPNGIAELPKQSRSGSLLVDATRELEQTHNIQNERDISVDKTVYENKLVESIIAPYLKAKPCDEPDKAKVDYGGAE